MGRERWRKWALELAGAVAWAHSRGVLHADIKPQNVLITSDFTLRLSDFGMSLILPSTTPTDPIGLGTPSYSAPELVRPAPSPFSFPSDIFSLGVTLSVLLTGHEPFSGMRAVERMYKIAQGGYWDWEERRRTEEIDGGSEYGGSRPPSRTGSAGLSRQGSGKSTSGLRRQSSIRSTRSRADSLDELDRGEMTTWTRDSLVARLLADDDGHPPSSPTSFSLPASPTFSTHSKDATLGFANLATDDGGEDSAMSPSDDYGHASHADLTYADGTPHQYFLSGDEVVPMEIRELLRAMTRPQEWERPSAREVLRRLEAMQ
ncbi:hypothetical protein RQP46_007214 [Phenoliferia psychrophenolica]